jgi:hypothetical protein
MTQEEAFSLSMAFLDQQGVSYRNCYAQCQLTDAHIQVFCRGPGCVLSGDAKNVWCFNFVFTEDELFTAEGASVFVDADTGECGLFVQR